MKKNTIYYNDCSLGNSGIMYTILEFMQATRGIRCLQITPATLKSLLMS